MERLECNARQWLSKRTYAQCFNDDFCTQSVVIETIIVFITENAETSHPCNSWSLYWTARNWNVWYCGDFPTGNGWGRTFQGPGNFSRRGVCCKQKLKFLPPWVSRHHLQWNSIGEIVTLLQERNLLFRINWLVQTLLSLQHSYLLGNALS